MYGEPVARQVVGDGLQPLAHSLWGAAENEVIVHVAGARDRVKVARELAAAVAVEDEVTLREARATQRCLQHRLAEVQSPAEAHRQHHHLRQQERLALHAIQCDPVRREVLGGDRRQHEELLHPVWDPHVVEGHVEVRRGDGDPHVARLEPPPGGSRRQLGARRVDERAVGQPRVEDDPQTTALLWHEKDSHVAPAPSRRGKRQHVALYHGAEEGGVVGQRAQQRRIRVRALRARLRPQLPRLLGLAKHLAPPLPQRGGVPLAQQPQERHGRLRHIRPRDEVWHVGSGGPAAIRIQRGPSKELPEGPVVVGDVVTILMRLRAKSNDRVPNVSGGTALPGRRRRRGRGLVAVEIIQSVHGGVGTAKRVRESMAGPDAPPSP